MDIDGVILTRDKKLPKYLGEFLSYITKNHDCYWLSTHCHGGNNGAIRYLSEYYPAAMLETLKRIKQTDWVTLKTEAIEFDSDFIWLEDNPFVSEKNVLRKHNKIYSLIIVNLKREGELNRVQQKIELMSAVNE